MKYICVTGGVVSSLGKGLAAAALGTLLEHRGLKVIIQKFDQPLLPPLLAHGPPCAPPHSRNRKRLGIEKCSLPELHMYVYSFMLWSGAVQIAVSRARFLACWSSSYLMEF